MKKLISSAAIVLLVISFTAGLYQFKQDGLVPLLICTAVLLPLRFVRPCWFRISLVIPGLMLAALSIDAFVFHHRLAVKARLWGPVFHAGNIVEPIKSPSEKTIAYVIKGEFADPSYFVYFSTRQLFPKYGDIEAREDDPNYQSDIIAKWIGPYFVSGSGLATSAWDERTGKFIDYYSWSLERDSASKTRLAFSEYLLSGVRGIVRSLCTVTGLVTMYQCQCACSGLGGPRSWRLFFC